MGLLSWFLAPGLHTLPRRINEASTVKEAAALYREAYSHPVLKGEAFEKMLHLANRLEDYAFIRDQVQKSPHLVEIVVTEAENFVRRNLLWDREKRYSGNFFSLVEKKFVNCFSRALPLDISELAKSPLPPVPKQAPVTFRPHKRYRGHPLYRAESPDLDIGQDG